MIASLCMLCVAVMIVGWLMVCGYLWTWGPFSSLSDERFRRLAGNDEQYSLEKVTPLTNSPIAGMHVCYLGSSVTFGAASLQTSFVEYIAKRNSATYVKEAVSGTTLVDEGIDSYISRLKKIDQSTRFDLFVCQLSTNDATQNKQLGKVAGKGQAYDIKTVCGAIEFIISYVRETWDCPVVFYTNSHYESETYASMVAALKEIRQVYGIGVIDLYTDEAFNDVSEDAYRLYMADNIHPTRAGYLLWWTPKIEEELYALVGRN